MREAKEIINFVLKSPISTKYKLMIKIHPTYSKAEFVKLVPDSLNGIFSFYDSFSWFFNLFMFFNNVNLNFGFCFCYNVFCWLFNLNCNTL